MDFGGATFGIRFEGEDGTTFKNFTIRNAVSAFYTHTTASTYNITISNITFESTTQFGLNLNNMAGGWSVGGLTASSSVRCVQIKTASGVNNFSNITCSGGTGPSIYIWSNSLGTNTFNTVTISGSTGNGIQVEGSSGAVFNNVESFSNTGSGFYVSLASSNVSLTDARIYNNGEDGVVTKGGSFNVTFDRVTSYANGSSGNINSGDGFTTHDADSNITFKNSVAYNNLNTAFALTGSSSGTVLNSVGYNNGGPTSFGGGPSSRAGMYINSTAVAGWVVKNYVGIANYPYEWQVGTGGPTSIYNYNQYYHIGNSATEASFASTDAAGVVSWSGFQGLGYDTNSNYGNPLFISTTTPNFQLQPLSPAIDSGTNVSLATDFLGNPIYGTPDIGAYEYQPPYTLGTHDIDITGSVRLYKNGRYRYTTATSSTATATINVTPAGGFLSSDYSEFLNMSISQWNTSGDYAKTWTETSTTATSTVHTIGDLAANTYYTVNVDGVQYAATQSNGSGEILFTYTGGYSTHTFNVSADAAGPLAFSPASPANGANVGSTQTFTWNATTDPSAGLAKYQLYVDGALNQDNIIGTSYSPSVGFTCGSHSWYVRAIDNAGNGTNSDTQSFTVSCGGGGIFAGTLPNTPQSRPQIIYPDGRITYLNEAASMTATTPTTIQKTSSSAAPSFTHILKRGSRGSDIITLQEFLKKDSIIYPEGLVTGYFGTLTERAIQRFQKKYGIVSSGSPTTTGYGLVGPKTRTKLNTLNSK